MTKEYLPYCTWLLLRNILPIKFHFRFIFNVLYKNITVTGNGLIKYLVLRRIHILKFTRPFLLIYGLGIFSPRAVQQPSMSYYSGPCVARLFHKSSVRISHWCFHLSLQDRGSGITVGFHFRSRLHTIKPPTQLKAPKPCHSQCLFARIYSFLLRASIEKLSSVGAGRENLQDVTYNRSWRSLPKLRNQFL
jgi:hypothetical protein